jgi:hypothetical protein
MLKGMSTLGAMHTWTPRPPERGDNMLIISVRGNTA